MTALQVFYLLLFASSIAFGLEVLLLGFGGKLSVLYRRARAKIISLAFATGMLIVGLATLTSIALGLEIFFTCAFLLAYVVIAGRAIGAFKPKILESRLLVSPPRISDEELRTMLEELGFEKLVKKRRKTERTAT